MRYAIFCAVSSASQAADDKISLEDQETRCRTTANARGWIETAGPFIVPGESRTIYINLRDAEAAIPQLRKMLDAAQRGRFDVLVIYNFNRLRELIDPITRTLGAYKVQIYSLTQNVEPQPPETYNPYKSDATWIMQLTSQLISKSQISDLRRKYEIGMPARVQKRGLPPIGIPFGYRKPPGRETDRAATPEPDPVTSPILLAFKDLLLQGRTLSQIVKFALGTGIKPPRGKTWYPQTIRAMLRNPFYAGYVRWGLSKNVTDPRTGQNYRQHTKNPAEIIKEPGKHTPLWDDATHAKIIAELESRGNNYGERHQNPLTRLLRCAACGQSLWMQHNGSRSEPGRSIWRCQTTTCTQRANIHATQALHQVAEQLATIINALSGDAQTEVLSDAAQLTGNAQAPRSPEPEYNQLAELNKRRARLTDIYLAGGINKPEYMQRAAEIDALITHAENTIAEIESTAASAQDRIKILLSLVGIVEQLPAWLAQDDAQTVNRLLRALIAHITVQGETVTAIQLK
jgi:site-specific DNA recombinase